VSSVIAFRRRRRYRFDARSIAAALLLAALLAAGYVVTSDESAEAIEGISFAMCSRPPHSNCVIDGDTF
jgi:hypothetical protein